MSSPSTGARFICLIVKNDSIKSDPHEIYGWRAFAMAGSACFGGMLFGFDIGTIGGVLELPEFQKYVASPSSSIRRIMFELIVWTPMTTL